MRQAKVQHLGIISLIHIEKLNFSNDEGSLKIEKNCKEMIVTTAN